MANEEDLSIGQQLGAVVGRGATPDLASLKVLQVGLIVDASVERRGLEHPDRQRAREARLPRGHLSQTHEVVEGGGDKATVQTPGWSLVGVGPHRPATRHTFGHLEIERGRQRVAASAHRTPLDQDGVGWARRSGPAPGSQGWGLPEAVGQGFHLVGKGLEEVRIAVAHVEEGNVVDHSPGLPYQTVLGGAPLIFYRLAAQIDLARISRQLHRATVIRARVQVLGPPNVVRSERYPGRLDLRANGDGDPAGFGPNPGRNPGSVWKRAVDSMTASLLPSATGPPLVAETTSPWCRGRRTGRR